METIKMGGAAIGAAKAGFDSGNNAADQFGFEALSKRMEQLAKSPPANSQGATLSAPSARTIDVGALRISLDASRDAASSFSLHVVRAGAVDELGSVSSVRFAWQGETDDFLEIRADTSLRGRAPSGRFGAHALAATVNEESQAPRDALQLTELWIDAGETGQPSLYAGLQGETLTGAWRLAPSVRDDLLLLDVSLRLFFRSDVAQLGVAPLSSMFLFGPANRGEFDDYRPRVHSSDGLLIETAEKLVSWRTLTNPPQTANSYIGLADLGAFGLMQRASGFEAYQDANAGFERQPSLLVAPVDDWGEGFVRLIERPASSETADNILAFWMPQRNFVAGERIQFDYTLQFGAMPPRDIDLAYVEETSAGAGGVSGVENASTLRKFVIDFRGQTLLPGNLHSQVDAFVSISRGTIIHSAVSRLLDADSMRLVIDADIDGAEPVELRAYLLGNGRQLTETWLYQWRRKPT